MPGAAIIDRPAAARVVFFKKARRWVVCTGCLVRREWWVVAA
jgi:hypothetical protein